MPIDMSLEEGSEAEENADEKAGAGVELQRKADLPLAKVAEAALFLANRELDVRELAKTTGRNAAELRVALEKVRAEYEARDSPVELLEKDGVYSLRVKPVYLEAVGGFSKKSDLSRKATRILALVVKKNGLLQNELRNYFRGEIYAYVTELREAGYLESGRHGNTRLLKPTRKFYEEFQLAQN